MTRLRDVPKPGRLIYLHRDFVVKIDHIAGEAWQSRQTAREIEFYETLTEDKQHFAEILDFGRTPKKGFWWLKQKRYYPDEIPPRDWKLTLEALRYKYNLADVWACVEPNANWMPSGGEVIVYDWAGYRA